LHKGTAVISKDIKVSVIVFNFSFKSYTTTTDNFDSLADLIASYPQITRYTHFVLVPGPLDITSNSAFPKRPLLSSVTGRLKARVTKVHFASNPCRIKYFGQEIVIVREDIMARMLRNLVGVKPNVRDEELKRYVNSSDPCLPLSITLMLSFASSSNPSWIKVTCYRLPRQFSPYHPTTTMLSVSIRCLQQSVPSTTVRPAIRLTDNTDRLFLLISTTASR
jgi:hypothetical protein